MALIVLGFVFLAGFRVATGISFPYSHWICECFEMFLLCKADVCQQHVKWAGQEQCPLLLFCAILSPESFTLPSERWLISSSCLTHSFDNWSYPVLHSSGCCGDLLFLVGTWSGHVYVPVKHPAFCPSSWSFLCTVWSRWTLSSILFLLLRPHPLVVASSCVCMSEMK